MAGNFHPAEVPYDPAGVDAAPSTQAPNDYFNVHANPDDFGGQVGQAFQHLGAGVKDAAEQFGQIQQLHNEASVNAALTSYMQGNQKLLYSPPQTDAKGNPVPNTGGYFSQNGANAVNGYQNTLAAADQNYQSSRAALNPRQQIMFDQLARRMHQSTLMEIGQHSTRQGEVWQDQQTNSFISTTSDAAVQAAVNGKPDDFDHYIDQGMSAAIHWSDLKGLGSDYGQEQASKFVGGTVANAAKQFIALGKPDDAQALLDKYGDKMDKGSALAVESALKTHTRDVQAQAIANGYLGVGPGVSDHGNVQTDTAQTGEAPHTSRPLPKEYADKGITQDQWDKMNASDQGAAPAQAGAPAAGNAPGGPTPSHAAATGGSNADAASVLRQFEGFRSSPYWDVNALRIGYGSDTVTKADGTVQRVTSGTQVTRADADRDLQRRAAISANSASNAIGSQQWAQLPGPAQAALTSVTYNYGHLPESVAAAAKTGDINKIADAVEALKGANGGVNAKRREQEAAIIRGGGSPGGAAPSVAGFTTGAPGMPPGVSASGQQLLVNQHPLSADGSVMPMMGGDQSAQPTDVGASHQEKADILQNKASVIADVQQRFAHDPEMATAIITKYNQGLAASSLAQQADAQQALAAQDAGFNKYYTAAMKGNVPANQLTQQIANDNTLSGTTKEHLNNAIQTIGQGKALGSDFYSYFKRIHSNGADKITSPDQLLAAVDGQSLTFEGANKLREELAGKKTVDGEAISDMKKAAMDYIKGKLTFEADYGTFKIPDPNGKATMASAVPAFYKAYEDGLSAGKTPFDLLTRGSKDFIGDKIIDAFKRTPAQEQKDYISAGGEPPSPGAASKPAPVASTFDLKKYNVATPEGQEQAANSIKADLDAGSISRVEAVSRLQALRAAATAVTAPQVPSAP